MFERLAILAPGLLGASLGAATHGHGLVKSVVVWARRLETRHAAGRQPWCSQVFDRPETAVAEADLVAICAPVEAIFPLAARIAPHLRAGALVTDVGSTKSLVCRHCHAVMPPGCAFVGSHPMAGSEKAGLDHAREDLFKGKTCFVTPLPETPESAALKIVHWWRDLDMQVATLSPESHDEIVAHISHLPHLLASALCAQLSRKNGAWLGFAGPGLADTTRVAGGSPTLWKAIFEQNREEVLRALASFEEQLQAFKAALANEEYFTLLHLLEEARQTRGRIVVKH